MKNMKFVSLILIVLMITSMTFTGCGYEYTDTSNTNEPKETSTTYEAPEFDKIFDNVDKEAFLKAYEMDSVKWCESPVTEQDYYNNFFYSFVRGDWGVIKDISSITTEYLKNPCQMIPLFLKMETRIPV